MSVGTPLKEPVRAQPPSTTPPSGGSRPRRTTWIVALGSLLIGALIGLGLAAWGLAPTKPESAASIKILQPLAPPVSATNSDARAQVAPNQTAVPTTKSVTLSKEADQAEATARGELYTPLFAEGRVALYGSLPGGGTMPNQTS